MGEIATLTTARGTLYRHADAPVIIEDSGDWLMLAPISTAPFSLDDDEWAVFVEMINAIDAARKAGESDGPV